MSKIYLIEGLYDSASSASDEYPSARPSNPFWEMAVEDKAQQDASCVNWMGMGVCIQPLGYVEADTIQEAAEKLRARISGEIRRHGKALSREAAIIEPLEKPSWRLPSGCACERSSIGLRELKVRSASELRELLPISYKEWDVGSEDPDEDREKD